MATEEFHKSISKELIILKDRVRYLVNNWNEDGIYKEAVLKMVIQKFLPAQFKLASGFILKETYSGHTSIANSTQVDLMIYDISFPTLFKEGDFVIITADAIKAVIEVKANLKNQGLAKVIKKSNQLGEFIYSGRVDNGQYLFNGIFSYEGYKELKNSDTIRDTIIHSRNDFNENENFEKFKVNHISFDKDWFYKSWNSDLYKSENNIYKIPDLSFSYFISYLMESLNPSVFNYHSLWFSPGDIFELKSTF